MPTDLPLRDIHLPGPIGWWPPAPGWWLTLLASVMLTAAGMWLWRRWRRVTLRKLALKELDALIAKAAEPREKLQQLSMLLRRVCLVAYPREDVAGMTGAAWLELLDRPFKERRFSDGPGRLLLDAPYRPRIDEDLTALLDLSRDWLRRLPEAGHGAGTGKP